MLESMDIDDYDEEDYDNVMGGWQETMNEFSMEQVALCYRGLRL